MLGKGSGKDFMSRITCAYIIYKLLCLKDPQLYYGKPGDDTIDIVNLALNADQAFNVFFEPLKKMLHKSEWFSQRIVSPHTKRIMFQKSVVIHSLHSDWEGAEGLNIILAVLDEIDGFTAQGYSAAMYNALSHTVVSRFPKFGKVLALSFPRSKAGWMMTTYDSIIAEKEVRKYQHLYKLNEKLEDGIDENEFTVTWDEDEIISYKQDNWYAIKAPTFRVNPMNSIDDYRDSFLADIEAGTSETLLRVCANPPLHTDTIFFKNQLLVEEAFDQLNGWNHKTETFECLPDNEKEYFVHVDLSKTSDRCVVGLGHVQSWQQVQIGGSIDHIPKPRIIIDLFRVWEPTPDKPVDNVEVVQFILELAKMFNVKKVTFDRWGSFDMIKYLNTAGVESEQKSLKRKEYEEFKHAVNDQRLKGPQDKRLTKEMSNLIIKNGNVVEPDGIGHYNDISEAVCGVINNCVQETIVSNTIEIITKDSVRKEMLQEVDQHARVEKKVEPDPVLRSFLTGIEFL